jgi:uncharacterized membrane protein HdeD (DUF308 family)
VVRPTGPGRPAHRPSWAPTLAASIFLDVLNIFQSFSHTVLGIWAVRSWQSSLVTLLTLVGVWAILYGVAEIFAAFSVRQAGKRAEHLLG